MGDTTIPGIDCYHGDSVQLHDLQSQGNQFCIIKATQGTGYVDPTFAQRWASLGDPSTGLTMIRGAYHFLTSANPDEVKHFLATVGPVHNCMPLALDVETEFLGLYTAVEEAVKFIKGATGYYPFLYCNKSFWDEYFAGTWVGSACPLWLARYQVNEPGVDGVVIWQWSEDGIDKDTYYGDLASLKANHYIK